MKTGDAELQLPLAGRRVLVVEDEYLIADDLATMLRRAGAEVLGPAASLPQAVRMVQHNDRPDAAVLDVNLRGVNVFPLAAELRRGGVPVMFLTGYGENSIPDEFADILRCEKPMGTTNVVTELEALIGPLPAASRARSVSSKTS